MKKELSNYFKLETRSDIKNGQFITSAIAEFIKLFTSTTEKNIYDIQNSAIEAIENAAAFAYPDKAGKISVQVSVFDERQVEIKVQDWGCGIKDVEKALEPLYTTGGENFSGLGFTIMYSFMDSLTVKSTPGKGTTVIMTKKLN